MNARLRLARDALLALVFHFAPRFANVVLFIVAGRLIGPDAAGVFALATTYLLILTTIMRGLDDLLIRQVSREGERAADYFASFFLLRAGLSLALYSIFIFIILPRLHYAPATEQTISLMVFSVISDGLTYVVQSTLLGQRHFGAPALVLGTVNLLKLVCGIIILELGAGIEALAWVWVLGSILGLIIMLTCSAWYVPWWRGVHWLDTKLIRRHRRAILSFVAITTLLAIDSQTDTVLLSLLRSEAEVGWYNAATTVTATLVMLVQAYRFSVYPLMTQYAQRTPDKLPNLYYKSIYYLGVVALPMAAGIAVLAAPIVGLVFGPKFAPTIPVLQILVWSLLAIFLGEPTNRMMLVHDRQRVLLYLLTFSATLNVILNLLLIPSFGANGSAAARVCSTALFFILCFWYVNKNLIKARTFPELIRPLAAVIIMVVIVTSLHSLPLFLIICVGALVYIGVLMAIGGIMREEIDLLKALVRRRLRVKE